MQYIKQGKDNDGSKIEKLETMNFRRLGIKNSNLKWHAYKNCWVFYNESMLWLLCSPCKDICLGDTMICAESLTLFLDSVDY